ncbi:TIM barrel protein [Escherichia coli]|nr:TIM barrel protein [Escherichia coli]EFD0478684.1 TIM barrel protein [Escherichia coli]KXQ55815.1 hypothetical protein AUQ04_09285 [Escherichia coli]
MKIGTQNQAFFPENILEKFRYIKEMGFDGFEIDGKLLVNNIEEVKAAIKETGLPVTTACGGYDGWIGDFIEERRLNGLKQIERILEALAEVGGKGIVVPAAWGMFTFRLPPMTSPRSLDGDRKMVSDSLRVLEQVAARTGTVVYLEPLNRYQDHMINTLADARRYIVENDLKHVQIIGDFYHMNTEVFLLPFHLFSDPTVARSLLRYRWHNLPGAQEKARRNGWQGALFPWESARSGEEETPEFAAINIRTGLRQKVASAQAEHHLVADIAWAVIQYWQTTGDESFIAHEGMALLLETAKFWISRAVRVNDRLEIHDVIGPDEYTEHVNNNAYTSYMARYNVQQALNIARQFGCSDDAFIHRAEMFLKELWMPEIQPDGVLPQDDSFMAKPAINLAKYKAAAGKQTILLDYSRAEVNEMQILKQADVVMLNYMLPEQFSAASCLANLQFYEPRTIHDSSLSKAIHGIVAARCGLLTQSYQFWREGTEIDLGADPHSCDDGIHAAATGAIWLGAIQGFAGVSVRDGELHLNPALPEQWQQLSFPLFWQGCELQVTLDAQRIAIRTSAPVSLRLNGQLITVAEESVFCLGDFILPFNGTATKHQEDE